MKPRLPESTTRIHRQNHESTQRKTAVGLGNHLRRKDNREPPVKDPIARYRRHSCLASSKLVCGISLEIEEAAARRRMGSWCHHRIRRYRRLRRLPSLEVVRGTVRLRTRETQAVDPASRVQGKTRLLEYPVRRDAEMPAGVEIQNCRFDGIRRQLIVVLKLHRVTAGGYLP